MLYYATALVSGLLCTSVAMATSGYFALGYGAKAMGLAGAVVSNPQDSIAAASNPAGMALVGERADLGVRFFSPIREAEISTSVLGASFDVDAKSRRNMFVIPSIGYTSQVNDRLYWGISVYGNGGMNSTYDRNLYDETSVVLGAFAQGGAGAAAQVPEGTTTPQLAAIGDLPAASDQVGKLGVDLAQVIFAPTLAWKAAPKHTLGASLLVGFQRFSARGLGNFQCLTSSVQADIGNNPSCAFGVADNPSPNLTNNGSEVSYGAGVRVGWVGELSPAFTVGAAVSSKIYMTEFDDYSELFAESGDFDIPANYSVGVTVKASPKLNLSLELQGILYEGVNAVSNAGPVPSPAGPVPGPGSGFLGADNGLGFGWEDIQIYRVAGEYMYDSHWTFRAGVAFNDQPIPESEVLFNILAPAVIEKHATVGFTYRPNSNSEWNFAYMHAFEETVNTSVSAFGIPASIKMYQNSVDLSYSLLF